MFNSLFGRLLLMPLFQDGADGTGGGAAPAATPAPATSGTTPADATGSAPATSQATQGTTQAPATGGAAPGEGWVPRFRLDEVRAAATRQASEGFQARERALQGELEQLRTQVRALVGVQPPADPQRAQVRDQFGQLYPGLSKLEDKADAVEQILEQIEDFKAQQAHYWQSYGRSSVDNLFKLAETSLGAPLNEVGKNTLHNAFVGYVQSTPERTVRYQQDPSIVQDFWKEFSSNLIDPVRRVATAGVATRAAGAANLPQDAPSGAVPTMTQAPKAKDLDERVATAWTAYQQRGGGQA